MRTQLGRAAVIVLLIGAGGCVRRTMMIRTEPVSGARVFVNDEEIGVSPVSKDFTWYGDYDVIIRHPDYETLKTHWRLEKPWYQYPPVDFVAEVLVPVTIHDNRHERTFTLEPRRTTTREELLGRADELRARALFSDE